jgi:hypothetical protein
MGLWSKDCIIWRFWERLDDGSLHPAMLVYNISDKPLTFSMNTIDRSRPHYSEKGDMRSHKDPDYERKNRIEDSLAALESEIVVGQLQIRPGGFEIVKINTPKRKTGFIGAVVNGKGCGMISDVEKQIPSGLPKHKYYSWESTNCKSNAYVICRDRLLCPAWERDSVQIYYRAFEDKPIVFGPHCGLVMKNGVADIQVQKETIRVSVPDTAQKIVLPFLLTDKNWDMSISYVANGISVPSLYFDVFNDNHGMATSSGLPVFVMGK